MPLLTFPYDILVHYLLPLLSDKDTLTIAGVNKQLRLAFYPYAFRTIRQDDGVRPNIISRVLQVFSNSPNVTFHVQEVVLLNVSYHDSVVNARALLCMVGSTLERLKLHEAVYQLIGFKEFFVEALQLCPNLKGLDLVVERVSQKWWVSGGKEGLAMAISSLSKLTNLSVSCGIYDWDEGADNDFASMMMERLKPAQLSEGLIVRSSEYEVATLLLQVAKQKAVKNLELWLYSQPTAEVLNDVRALSLFADFDRLQSLNVTFAGFTYMSSAFTRLCNLRHLTMGSMECYDEDVWNNFSEVFRSGDLSQLESFAYHAKHGYDNDATQGSEKPSFSIS
ncbi:hypothetical protein BC829DRAFT_253289 [Chytridium lagenaria]|nr:hypothetical protein BC829DRAFT_253289 [Chytridium lagenaria]